MNGRPWVAALTAFLFSPVLGMLGLGRGLWSISYLLAAAWVFALPLLAVHFGLLTISVWSGIAILGITVGTVGAVHCYCLAAQTGKSKSGKPKSEDRFVLLYALLAIPLFLAMVPKLLWEPYNMPSSSMVPSLQVGDYFFVSAYAYRFADPERGDLIVFLTPGDNATVFVKRLIGLPGDRIQMKEGVLYLNGQRVPRSDAGPAPAQDTQPDGRIYRETLPGGRNYLIREVADNLMFDNTDVYEVPTDHYFVMGDNRDNSMDSRTRLGYVPRDNLRGRLAVIVWNMEAQRPRLFDAD